TSCRGPPSSGSRPAPPPPARRDRSARRAPAARRPRRARAPTRPSARHPFEASWRSSLFLLLWLPVYATPSGAPLLRGRQREESLVVEELAGLLLPRRRDVGEALARLREVALQVLEHAERVEVVLADRLLGADLRLDDLAVEGGRVLEV